MKQYNKISWDIMAKITLMNDQWEAKSDALVEQYNTLSTFENKLQMNHFIFEAALHILDSLKNAKDENFGLARAEVYGASFMMYVNSKMLLSLISSADPSHKDKITACYLQQRSTFIEWQTKHGIAELNDEIFFPHVFS